MSDSAASGAPAPPAAAPAPPAAAPAPPAAAPARDVEASGRIAVLDVLRGIALLGMYVVHFGYAMRDGPGSEATHSILGWLFEGRFHAMFGILFGVGFAVMLRGATARGERFVPRFLRRLAMLAVFGVIAEVGFGYNVLVSYALWGAPLLLFRDWPVRWLVIATVVAVMSQSLYAVARGAYWQATAGTAAWRADGEATQAANRAHNERYARDTESPDRRTVIAARLRHMPWFYAQPFSWLPSNTFALFLVGLLGWRLGVYQRPWEHRRVIAGAMLFGVAAWAIGTWAFPIVPVRPPDPDEAIVPRVLLNQANRVFFLLLDPRWLVFTYMGAVLLVAARRPARLAHLAPFGWAGRMALTNYMTQVLVLDVLTSNYALGLRFPAIVVPLGALALFGVQAAWSRWWLARHRLGPLEWLWRCVTYWRWEPNRRDAALALPATASP